MLCCKCECAYLSIIVGIIAGVILGVLYSVGLVATGIIFWVYLLIGILGIFLTPLYADKNNCQEFERCYCNYKNLITISAVGTIIFAVLSIIFINIVSIILGAVIIGIATFFPVLLLSTILCLARCLCKSRY